MYALASVPKLYYLPEISKEMVSQMGQSWKLKQSFDQ